MDTLNGGNQADELWGNSGLDILNGGPQRDVLWGGGDPDQLTGGPARDTFHGAPDEALDFAAEDENFSDLFDPEGDAVLPGQTVWNRIAEGEPFNGHRLTDPAQQAGEAIGNAWFAASEGGGDTFFIQWGALSGPDRQAFSQALEAVTNGFSPDVVANPAALTAADLQGLRNELVAAAQAANPALAGSYAQLMSVVFDDLSTNGFVGVINQLSPGTPETHGVLFALDALLNLS
jgi:Ca2+-binding RTX toxin-like protein